MLPANPARMVFCSLDRTGQGGLMPPLMPLWRACNVSALCAFPFCFRQEDVMHRLHYGVIAVALFAGTSVVAAQQEKTQQNSADEALTRSAPEAKDSPQAPAAAR